MLPAREMAYALSVACLCMQTSGRIPTTHPRRGTARIAVNVARLPDLHRKPQTRALSSAQSMLT